MTIVRLHARSLAISIPALAGTGSSLTGRVVNKNASPGDFPRGVQNHNDDFSDAFSKAELSRLNRQNVFSCW
jgi:hypothetical protein